jgi:hypothetical protein
MEKLKAPVPSPIENVFAMSEPQHMLSKLLWEIDALTQSQSVWVDNETFPTPIFRAWNAAVTAWHKSHTSSPSPKMDRARYRAQTDKKVDFPRIDGSSSDAAKR